jgi:hypothetical protein
VTLKNDEDGVGFVGAFVEAISLTFVARAAHVGGKLLGLMLCGPVSAHDSQTNTRTYATPFPSLILIAATPN